MMFKPSQTGISRWVIVLTVMLGTTTVSLNNSALNPAIPAFMSVFSIGPVSASWIISAFMISMGMTMPLTGYFSHRFGNKVMYLCGLVFFLIGSTTGMLANNMLWVIVARCIQGIASGLMIPLSLVLIFSVYAKHERGYITGIWGAAVMLAPAVGPFIGGLLLEFSSWRMLFAMNIPVGLIGLLIGLRSLPSNHVKNNLSFDWLGFILVFSGLGLLMWVLSDLKAVGETIDSTKIAFLIASVLILVTFAKVELKKEEPLLNLRIFGNKQYTFSVIIVVAHAIGMFGCLVLIPILVQIVLGYSPMWTGFVLLCTAVSASCFVKFGGEKLDTHGPKHLVSTGLLLTGLSTMLLGRLSISSSVGLIIALMIVRGIGIGLSYIPSTTAGLNAIPESLVAQGSAMNNIFRRIISSIAVIAVAIYIEVRHQKLVKTGWAEILANHTAVSEAFLVIGILILCALPFAWFFPTKNDNEEKADSASRP